MLPTIVRSFRGVSAESEGRSSVGHGVKPGMGVRAPRRDSRPPHAQHWEFSQRGPGCCPLPSTECQKEVDGLPDGLLSGRPTLCLSSGLDHGAVGSGPTSGSAPQKRGSGCYRRKTGGNSDKTASVPFPIDDGLQEKVLITFVELLIKMTFAHVKTQTQVSGRQSACRPFWVAVSPRSAAGLCLAVAWPGPEYHPRSPHRTVDVRQAACDPTGSGLTFVRFPLTHLPAVRGGLAGLFGQERAHMRHLLPSQPHAGLWCPFSTLLAVCRVRGLRFGFLM